MKQLQCDKLALDVLSHRQPVSSRVFQGIIRLDKNI